MTSLEISDPPLSEIPFKTAQRQVKIGGNILYQNFKVYYLPKMVRGAKEDPIDFADRCKSAIARAGGLVDRVWDGNLKVKS